MSQNGKTERKQIRLPADLKKKAEAYCKRTHQTFTEVTTRFWVRLLEEDIKSRQSPADAEQI